MFISDSEKNERLNGDNNLLNRLEKRKNRRVGDVVISESRVGDRGKEVPEIIRELAGTAARAGSDRKELAQSFGLEQPAISNYANGKVGGKPNSELEERIKVNTDKIRDVAVERLMVSLGLITDEKMENCKARDLSGIAANLSRVVEKVSPKENTNPFAGVQIVFYSPRMKSLNDFEVIDVERSA